MLAMFTKTHLPNGLRVITHPMTGAKSVAVMVMLAAGSRYETKQTNGIAHFAEHMFFKGTEKRPTAKDISAEVDGIGGEFNAFTGKEYTGYYIKCAAEHRSLALDVLADQLLASRFDPEEIEREKGVIIEELNMYLDTPETTSTRSTRRCCSAISRWGGTSSAPRRRSARPAVRRSSATWTAGTPRGGWWSVPPAPSTATSWPRWRRSSATSRIARAARWHAVDFVQIEPRVRLETRESDQAHLRLGVRGIPTDSPDRYAMQVLTAVLGGGMSSRLFIEVRERLGLAYYVYGYHQSYADTGTLFSQAGVDIERIDQAVSTIVASSARWPLSTYPMTSCGAARTTSRAAWCCSWRTPRGC